MVIKPQLCEKTVPAGTESETKNSFGFRNQFWGTPKCDKRFGRRSASPSRGDRVSEPSDAISGLGRRQALPSSCSSHELVSMETTGSLQELYPHVLEATGSP